MFERIGRTAGHQLLHRDQLRDLQIDAGGAVFAVAAIMNLIVVLMALFVVRPMRLSISASENKSPVGQAAE